jgi:hypothetical protein
MTTLALLITGWFSYLAFLTVYTFRDFVGLFEKVIEILVARNLWLVQESIQRPNPVWMQIVTYKAVYISLFVLLGIIASLMNAWKTNDDVDKAAFTIQLFTTAIIGAIAIALGGAGYVERLLMLSPLITYSLIKLVGRTYANTNFHLGKLGRPVKLSLAALALTSVIFVGIVFYFSGRNFQSITYSEIAGPNFITEHDPRGASQLYYTRISPVSEGIVRGFRQDFFYSISMYDTIFSVYYIVGDPGRIANIYADLSRNNSQIYDNKAVQILRSLSP